MRVGLEWRSCSDSILNTQLLSYHQDVTWVDGHPWIMHPPIIFVQWPLCVKILGLALNPRWLWSHSSNGYLVHRSKAGSTIVAAFCCNLIWWKVKDILHDTSRYWDNQMPLPLHPVIFPSYIDSFILINNLACCMHTSMCVCVCVLTCVHVHVCVHVCVLILAVLLHSHPINLSSTF